MRRVLPPGVQVLEHVVDAPRVLRVDHRVQRQGLFGALHAHGVEAAQVRAQQHRALLGVAQALEVLLAVAAHPEPAGLAAQEEERVHGGLHEAQHVVERRPEAERQAQAAAQLVAGLARHTRAQRVVERQEEAEQARGAAAEQRGQHHHRLDAHARAVLGHVPPAARRGDVGGAVTGAGTFGSGSGMRRPHLLQQPVVRQERPGPYSRKR
jgi:hypothetical protein